MDLEASNAVTALRPEIDLRVIELDDTGADAELAALGPCCAPGGCCLACNCGGGMSADAFLVVEALRGYATWSNASKVATVVTIIGFAIKIAELIGILGLTSGYVAPVALTTPSFPSGTGPAPGGTGAPAPSSVVGMGPIPPGFSVLA